MPIPIDQFKTLPRVEKGSKGASVSNEDLIAELTKHALSTKEVSTFLGVQTGTAYSRLQRLEGKGIVFRVKGDDNLTYWGYDEDYVAPVEEDEEEEEE